MGKNTNKKGKLLKLMGLPFSALLLFVGKTRQEGQWFQQKKIFFSPRQGRPFRVQ